MTMRYLKSLASCFAFRRSASLNITAACIEFPCTGPKRAVSTYGVFASV
jgi:hypothetical protein